MTTANKPPATIKARTTTTKNSSNRIAEINITQFGNQLLTPQNPRQLNYNDVVRLHQLHENNALIATYTYTAYGQRTRKVTNQSTIVYHYDQAGMLISETLADGTPIRDYIRSDGSLVAQIDSNGNEQIRYLHTDHLNTARIATNEQGTLIWRWQGDGFGKTKPELDPDQNGQDTIINLRFPGQYFDVESGWFYNYFRYYDPQTGRYITSDPIGLDGGLNTYAYVSGNPLTSVDPFGLAEIVIWAGVGNGTSSFGHVSSNVNGTSYSWGPSGMDVLPTNEYMNRNQEFRSGLGFNLPLTPPQDNRLQQCLSYYQGDYNPATNNCGAPIQFCLNQIGINLNSISGGTSILPGGLGFSLYTSMPGVTTTRHPVQKSK